jgi:hypothetical protein
MRLLKMPRKGESTGSTDTLSCDRIFCKPDAFKNRIGLDSFYDPRRISSCCQNFLRRL